MHFTRQVVPATFCNLKNECPFFIPVFLILKVLFVSVSYAINIINVFHNVNLALYMVISIHSIETWKQMEVVRRFEREENQV